VKPNASLKNRGISIRRATSKNDPIIGVIPSDSPSRQPRYTNRRLSVQRNRQNLWMNCTTMAMVSVLEAEMKSVMTDFEKMTEIIVQQMQSLKKFSALLKTLEHIT
jgi:hypothetical protein